MREITLKDSSASEMLKAWGCIHTCGKTVLGAQAGKFSDYSRGRDDIAEVFIITPRGRIPSARSGTDKPAGFEVKVHLAAEAFNGTPEIKDRYWKLITFYPDGMFIKHIYLNGRILIERKATNGI